MPHPTSLFTKTQTGSHPLRVLAVFAIGIIVPSGFLSYLGFRSLQVENLLQRKQAEDRYSAVADLMQHKVTEMVAGLVRDVRQTFMAPAFQRGDFAERTRYLLGLSTLAGAPVHGLYLFDTQGHLLIPAPAESDRRNASAAGSGLEWGAFSSDIARLEHLEFVNKNVAAAVKGYEALLARVNSPILRAALLKNIAGGYRKLNNPRAAEARYLELIRRYDQTPDPVGYPAGILGRQLLAELYDGSASFERALAARLDLMEGLILGRWALSPHPREILHAQTVEAISKSLAGSAATAEDRARWARLQAMEKRLAEVSASAQAFVTSDWPDLQRRLRERGWWEEGGVLRESPKDGLVIAVPLEGLPGEGRTTIVVAQIAGEPFLQGIQKAVAELAQSAGLQIDWGDLSQNPGARLAQLTSALRPHVERAVNALDPPLQFRLLESASLPQEVLRRRREWVYIGMIALSFMVILVGFVVMAQAVRREIEVANLKSDFVANVSHELRTPLSAISYIGERLSLGRYRSPEEAKEFYSMLGEETVRLRELIEDILDFSKMLDGRKVYRKEPADLVAVAQEAIQRFRGKAQSQGFQVSAEWPASPVMAPLDRRAALQAVLNLLDNALKYSPESREIRLRVAERNGSGVLEVQDFGMGISSDQQGKIFEKFYRVEDALTRPSEGGVGLGLAMVKHIMEGHNGRVTVVSELGKGSTFSLWFERTAA